MVNASLHGHRGCYHKDKSISWVDKFPVSPESHCTGVQLLLQDMVLAAHMQLQKSTCQQKWKHP